MRNIYIVLSQTGTLFSRAVHQYTKDPYNHASIAFDASLEMMYSFGRRRRYNILDNGFIQEHFDRGLFTYFPNARCCVLEIPVSEAEYEAMRETVALFERNLQDYRYNLMGVMFYPTGLGITRRNHFFCSQFVSFVLGKTSFWHGIPELTRPIDFMQLSNKRLLYEGTIAGFPRAGF